MLRSLSIIYLMYVCLLILFGDFFSLPLNIIITPLSNIKHMLGINYGLYKKKYIHVWVSAL
jgi:hypothetical protein